MVIRKLTYAPNDVLIPPPKAEINKSGLKLEASLEREVRKCLRCRRSDGILKRHFCVVLIVNSIGFLE
jgi:hypothetical protein